MTSTFLQDALQEELQALFDGLRLEDPYGKRAPINVYKQRLPVPVAKDIPSTVTDMELEEGMYNTESVTVPFPYIIVRLEDGIIEKIDREQTVHVNLLIGVIDRNPDNQGHKDVLNLIQRITERFLKNPGLAETYACLPPIEWALQEEGSYPYFFGGMAMTFETAPIVREDPYA